MPQAIPFRTNTIKGCAIYIYLLLLGDWVVVVLCVTTVVTVCSDNEGSEREILEELLKETRIRADVRVSLLQES